MEVLTCLIAASTLGLDIQHLPQALLACSQLAGLLVAEASTVECWGVVVEDRSMVERLEAARQCLNPIPAVVVAPLAAIPPAV